MTEYAISLSNGFRFDLGSFLFSIRPLLAVAILGFCLYIILKKPKSK